MSKRVKVKLTKKRPLDPYIDRQATAMAKGLVARFRPAFRQVSEYVATSTKKALSDNGIPSPEEITALHQMGMSILTPDGKELTLKHSAKSFAFGVAQFDMARDDFDAVLAGATPRADEVEKVMSEPGFTDRRALEYAQSSAYLSTWKKDNDQFSSFLRELLIGLQNGENPRTIANRVATELEENPKQWETLARSEMATALAQGSMDEARRLNVKYVYVPSHPDASVACQQLIEDRVFGRDWLQGQSNVGKKRAQWGAAVPCHPNCRHTVIPVSRSLLAYTKKQIGSNEIPVTGVKVDYVPPSER